MGELESMRWLGRALLAAVIAVFLSAPSPAADEGGATTVVVPRERITLYDGKEVADLRCFTTWLGDHGRDDPHRVYTLVDLVDGAPAIRISGEDWGGLITREHYRDYRLVVEFRWGTISWNKRKHMARNSGILFHCQGEDGNHAKNFKSPWIRSVEYEIQEGRTGAVVLVGGFDRDQPQLVCPTLTMRTKSAAIWDPAGEPITFDKNIDFLFPSTYDVGWQDVLGFRGRHDRDVPVGAWNRVEIRAQGSDIVYFLNGHRILEGTECSLDEGRIMLQSEGAEIFFRLVELHPISGRE